MKHTRVLLPLLACFLPAVLLASAPDFSGKWQGSIRATDSTMPAYLVLKQSGEEVTGTAGPSADKQVSIKSARLNGARLRIEVDNGDAHLAFELVRSGQDLSGTCYESGDEVGPIELKRVE